MSNSSNIMITGSWMGWYESPNEYNSTSFLAICFVQKGDGEISGTYYIPSIGRGDERDIGRKEVINLKLLNKRIQFALSDEKKIITFEGELQNNTITGKIIQEGTSGAFELYALADLSTEVYEEYIGTYQFQSGRIVGIYERGPSMMMHPHYLVYHDFDNGDMRVIFPVSENRFIYGPSIAIGYPTEAEITFNRDPQGGVTSLSWRRGEDDEVTAKRLQFHEEEIKYRSGDIELAGFLTVPSSKGPHPAIVQVHGSAPWGRHEIHFRAVTGFLASHGFAVLSYDKRGVGDSGGIHDQHNETEENLMLLAQDVVAGLEYLKGRGDIDENQLGIYGVSQAGKTIPIALDQTNLAKFAIIRSGGCLPVGVQAFYAELTHYGFIKKTITWDEIAEIMRNATISARDKSEFLQYTEKFLEMPEYIKYYVENEPPAGFGSFLYTQKISIPTLFIFGGLDRVVHAKSNTEALEWIKENKNVDFDIVLFQKGDHKLVASENGWWWDIPYSLGYESRFFITMLKWLLKRVNMP